MCPAAIGEPEAP